MMNNKFTIAIIGGACLLFLVMNYFGSLSDKKKFLEFSNSTIKGALTSYESRRGANDIIVNNKKYRFVSNFDNNGLLFEDIAKSGDIIYKQANSDTLKLIHNGKVYFYTFKKF